MKKILKIVTLLTLTALFIMGCETKIRYIPMPVLDPLTKPLYLDKSKIGLKRLSATTWEVKDEVITQMETFTRQCFEREADFESTTKAINTFNKSLEELND